MVPNPRGVRRVIAVAVACVLIPTAAPADNPAGPKLSDEEKALVELTNAERKKAGLPPLKPDPRLFEAARSHAANMAKQDTLAHDLDGKSAADRVTATGYKFTRTGENVGWNWPTPKDAVAGWMDSAPHAANILNEDYTDVGVGVAKNEKGEPYWVQVFGARRGE